MSRAFSVRAILRAISLILVFAVPALYLREILPVWSLSLVAIIAVGVGYTCVTIRLRSFPAFLLVIVAGGALFALFYALTLVIAHAQAGVAFLRLSLGFWVIFSTASLCLLSTLAWHRAPRWRIAEPLVLLLLFSVLLWSQGNHTVTLFPHPLFLALFACAMVIVTLTRLALETQTEAKRLLPILAYLPIAAIALFFVLEAFNAMSVTNNGGLIQPTLFRFDFSPYLSLQNEIKLNDKLILIVRTAEENSTTLLRRIYLSGWNPDKGFFEENPSGERKQITTVPGKRTDIPHDTFSLRTAADQEYFIVNFDPTSLVAMDYPVQVTPYRIWDSNAFNGAYAVTSEITGFMPFELFESDPPSGKEGEGLTLKSLAYYTAIDAKTKALVEKIALDKTKDVPGYYDKIQALTSYLRDGDFRYSLKPGVAPDGDQLRYFLEDSRKGYCTYFAFSLCLMLRSIGIPSRIAAGFFLRPDSGALGYYPVRANMAHAWVEVFFPKYGWIAFDPTSNELAEGENLQIDSNPGGDEFLNLLAEIIDNRALLLPDNRGTIAEGSGIEFLRSFSAFLKRHARGYLAGLALLGLSIPGLAFARRRFLMYRSRNARKAILLIASETYRILWRNGYRKHKGESRYAFASRLERQELSALVALEQRARFAPSIGEDERQQALALYRSIKNDCARRRRRNPKSILFILVFFVSFRALSAQESRTTEELLLAQAKAAIEAENWATATSVLTGAIRSHPTTPSFHYVLGKLYSDQKLYVSARKELLTALDLGYPDIELFSTLSEISSLLNLDEESLGYLRRYLTVKPDDLVGWSNFGWLCYKTNRLDEGIAQLHAVLAKYGPDSNLYVGLGNLYTAAFDYEDAKKNYTLAIQNAERLNQPYHVSIDYYNRSILEEIFYHFDDAYRDTTLSLEATPRASGYLMQGELELRRHAFRAAFTQYLKAYNLDSTPLASMGLADTLSQAGYPEEALQYMDAIERKTDLSWISNYGTTIDQYKADIHKTRADIYKFLKTREKRRVIHSFSTLIIRCWKSGAYTVRAWYHDAMNRVMTARVARYYETSEKEYNKISGEGLRVNSFYYMAFNKWRRLSEPYLFRAKTIETTRIPAALPSYLYEEAHQTGNMNRMEEAIGALNPEWERQILSKALVERLNGSPRLDKQRKYAYLQRLYSIHPAAFVLHDIRLPVSFDYLNLNSRAQKRFVHRIERRIPKVGFKIDSTAPFILRFEGAEESLTLALVERNSNQTIYTQVINFSTDKSPDIYSIINRLSTEVFRTDIGL